MDIFLILAIIATTAYVCFFIATLIIKLIRPEPPEPIKANPCEAALLRILKGYIGGTVEFHSRNLWTRSTINNINITEHFGVKIEVTTFEESFQRNPWASIEPKGDAFLFPITSINLEDSPIEDFTLNGHAQDIGEFWLKRPKS